MRGINREGMAQMAFTHFSDLDLPAFSRELELSFVNFYLGFSDGESFSRYPHARLIFFFRSDGTGFFDDDGGNRRSVHGGDWILIPPFVGVRHRLNASAPHLSLHFTLLAYRGFDMLAGVRHVLGGSDPALTEEIQGEIRRNDKITLMLLFQELCWKCLRRVKDEFPAFERIPALYTHPEAVRLLRLLTDNASPDLTMEKLARLAGIPRNTLIKRLTAAAGMPPGHAVDRILVSRAIRLLTEKQLSVKETAAALDFRDPYGFSRFFRRMTGSSPSQFRLRFQRAPLDAKRFISEADRA